MTDDAPLVYLVRHGVTDANAAAKYEGRGDSDISSLGVRQALDISRMLAGKRVAVVYSSLKRRAIHTAEIISGELGLVPVPLEGLAEVDFGEWDGLTFEEVSRRYPTQVDRWITDPLETRPPGGETLLEMWTRVCTCLVGEVLAYYGSSVLAPNLDALEAGSTVVVSHGGPIRAILSFIECGDLSAFQQMTIRPGEMRAVPVCQLERMRISGQGGTCGV